MPWEAVTADGLQETQPQLQGSLEAEGGSSATPGRPNVPALSPKTPCAPVTGSWLTGQFCPKPPVWNILLATLCPATPAHPSGHSSDGVSSTVRQPGKPAGAGSLQPPSHSVLTQGPSSQR